MKLTPVSMYSQNNCDCKRKASPAFGNIYFTREAANKLPQVVLSFEPNVLSRFGTTLKTLMNKAEGLPDIVVHYVEKGDKFIAKLPKILKKGYDMKTFAQKDPSDLEFLKKAVAYAEKLKIYREKMPEIHIKE
mgnify:CR=1 FL=1